MNTMNEFDWDAVRAFVAKRKPITVSAGILNDWFWTGATIYTKKDGWIENHGAYLSRGMLYFTYPKA